MSLPLPHATSPPGAALAGARDRALFANFFMRELRTRYLGSATGLAWALLHPLALLGGLPLRLHHDFSRGELRRQELSAVRRGRVVAVARRAGRPAARDGQPRELRRPDPQGRVSRTSSSSTRRSPRRWRCSSRAISRCLSRSPRSASPCTSRVCVVAVPLWLMLAIAVTGLALFLAALQVFIRDVEHVLMPVLMILMYLTPILYPLTLVPEGVRPWVAANPFGWLVERLRDALLDGRLAPRVGRRRRARRGARALLRRALGIPAPVAAVRGLRMSPPRSARRRRYSNERTPLALRAARTRLARAATRRVW